MHQGCRKRNSIIHKSFQGELKIEQESVISISTVDASNLQSETGFGSKLTPFLFLTLDLPPAPLFHDEKQRSAIPQVSLLQLLERFNGKTRIENGKAMKFSIHKLPEYLIFCVKRFSKNIYLNEKNPTIINFPLENLDMKPFLSDDCKDLQTKYDLAANIIYEGGGTIDDGLFKVEVVHPNGTWYQIQDLYVVEIAKEMINLSETCIQIWKKGSRQREPAQNNK